MQADNVIEVHDITKSFKVYYDKGRTLKERLVTPERNKTETRWVLKGISFDVKKGEAIGLIGKNGCGKSTTLKLLTRIIYPDSGCIDDFFCNVVRDFNIEFFFKCHDQFNDIQGVSA